MTGDVPAGGGSGGGAGDATGAGDVVADVVVVGGGLAGWSAAVRARELGARVTLVERSPRRPGWGNSLLSGGALHAALRDPRTPPGELAAEVDRLTDGRADPAVVHAWATHAVPALDWARDHGAVLVTDGGAGHRARVLAPVRDTVPGLRYARSGTTGFLSHLRDRFLAGGGVVRQPYRARELVRHPAGWAVHDGRVAVAGRSVILADGGFQADPALLRRHVGTDRVRLRGAGTATGDALRMGRSAGAATVQMSGFYGHLLARQARHDPQLWPYPILDVLAEVGIVVGPDGRRIVDEGHHGVTTTNAVAWSATPDNCWLVVDDAAWREEGRIGTTPPNPYLPRHGVTVHSAPTVEALAAACGIDPAGLRSTVDDLAGPAPRPPRTGRVRLSVPPWRAIALIAGVTFTLGGLRVDGQARLLDGHATVIPGLYAAGGAMGGLHGGPRAGYAGGLLEALVFGLIAGEHAATRPA